MYTRRHNQSGFTLIEMIVAMAIFTVTVLVATNVYLLVSNSQRRALASQKILDDVRALFETMTQEVRLGTINYDYYESQGTDLHPAAGSGVDTLALRSQSGELVFFRHATDRVQYCTEVTAGECDTAGTGWLDVTPVGVNIEALSFTITPSADPFANILPVDCQLLGDAACTAAGLDSYRCGTDDICRYYSNGDNVQPHVLIMIKSTAIGQSQAERASVNMQTLVSSRIITSALQNQYHD
ncbi:MAG: prepilin-type N-terminal cleavage/methylation domain-containing protein [Candidatus Kerfeldbacteria bacterium]|nr:prepilin-type N-terminal cleavage/methylation domain-containing protein [Candidatus Kerfeldbacteria bacterium]